MANEIQIYRRHVPAAPRPGWLDRLIVALAPAWGLRRLRARATAYALRHYEAARPSYRTENWYRSSGDADTAGRLGRQRLRELARDLRRNNGWARRGIGIIANNTVGWGIPAYPVAGTHKSVTAWSMAAWKAWAESPQCDFWGRATLYALQRQVVEAVAEGGECLVRRRIRAGQAVPLALQILEPEYLSELNDSQLRENNGHIIDGIEYDATGRRVAYWLYKSHPGAMRMTATLPAVERVPADEVLHIYRQDRPEQQRGISWLAAAIVNLNDFEDYSQALLVQQKIAAYFGAFVTDPEGSPSPQSQVGKPDPDQPERLETLELGQVNYLRPGEQITFPTPPPAANAEPVGRIQLRRIAADMEVTYEELTGDMSQVNFSSARMSRITHWANVYRWQWQMVVPQLCDPVWRWFGAYYGPAWPAARWAPGPMPMLEPDREGLAYQRLVRNGAMTIPQMMRERGEDPDEMLREIAEFNAKMDAAGVVLDSDPRKTTVAGQEQAATSSPAGQPAPAD